jgi:hypothetical protein
MEIVLWLLISQQEVKTSSLLSSDKLLTATSQLLNTIQKLFEIFLVTSKFRMQFTNFFGFAAILSVAVAIPVAEPVDSPASLSKRDDGGVELCTDAGFTNHYVHIIQPNGECGKSPSPLDSSRVGI